MKRDNDILGFLSQRRARPGTRGGGEVGESELANSRQLTPFRSASQTWGTALRAKCV